MTIWVLQQKLTPEEETHIHEKEFLTLPFDGLPDLSAINSQAKARKLLVTLYPDDPPETINHRVDRFWSKFIGFHVEDVIVVALLASQEVILAEITGGYQYRVGENGEDIHLVPVKFYEKHIPMRVFNKHKELFDKNREEMFEVTDPAARIVIRDQLPHAYNRFAKFKWILALGFLMGLMRIASQIRGH